MREPHTLWPPNSNTGLWPHHCWQCGAHQGKGPLGEGGSPGCSWKPRRLISKKPAEGQEGWGKAQDGFRFHFFWGWSAVSTQGTWMGGESIAGTASQGQVVAAQLIFRTWTRLVAQRSPTWPLSQL